MKKLLYVSTIILIIGCCALKSSQEEKLQPMPVSPAAQPAVKNNIDVLQEQLNSSDPVMRERAQEILHGASLVAQKTVIEQMAQQQAVAATQSQNVADKPTDPVRAPATLSRILLMRKLAAAQQAEHKS